MNIENLYLKGSSLDILIICFETEEIGELQFLLKSTITSLKQNGIEAGKLSLYLKNAKFYERGKSPIQADFDIYTLEDLLFCATSVKNKIARKDISANKSRELAKLEIAARWEKNLTLCLSHLKGELLDAPTLLQKGGEQ